MASASKESTHDDDAGNTAPDHVREGQRLLEDAARAGHAWAMANLAQHLLRSAISSNSSSLARAANLFTRAWQVGQVSIAPFNTYQVYSTLAQMAGEPQAVDARAKAEEWLFIAAEQARDVTAQYQLACILQKRRDVRWLPFMREAAEAGLTVAQHNFAVHLLEQNQYANALLFFRAASSAGFIHSTFNLGLMYLNGQGVEPDAASARVYLSQAFVSGDEALKQQVLMHMDPFHH